MLTLNQIVSQITTLAAAHNQIAESGVGDFAEWQAKERSYPILWVFHESTSVNQMEIAFSIRLICADRVIVGEEGDNTEGHEQEVLSDTLLVLLDFLAYFQQNHSQPYNVVTSATIDPFTERLNDRLAGNSVTIQIRQPFDWNKCQIPQSGASIPPSVDGLTLYNFCDASVLARLTPAQVECLQVIAEDANWELYNTEGTLLDTGSIPSGDTDSIVAPDATVLRDGVAFGTVASGDVIDVPSNGGGVSLAVTVSDTTPDNGDTVTITATPSVGFTPTEYTYLLFDGVNITLLAQQAGNTFNWTVTQSAGLYDIYVLATDGTDYAWNEQQVDVQATYLLGVYSQDVATMFATFRLLSVFNTRLMEIRRTVGATTTVVEIGLDGDYTTLDSPVLAVVTGSSSATTLGEFVAAAGYTDVDGLGSPQSAFAVRGYFQLDGSQAWEQLTPTHQPRLVNSGVLEVLDGKGCLAFSGNQWQDYGLITGANKPANYTTLTVCSVDNTNAQGVFGSRPAGNQQTPFSYGHLWANQGAVGRAVYLFGNGTTGQAQYNPTVNTIVTSAIQYHEDYKSSGVDGSQVFTDGVGPFGLAYGANSTNNVAGAATRMLYGRLGDLAGNLMTGRQLFFGVYEANKIADRLGIKQIINSITGQSW